MPDAYFDTVTMSFSELFSRASMQVIIFVVLAIGRGVSESLLYKVLPEEASIRQADLAYNFKEAGLELWSVGLFNNMEVLLGGYITGDKNEQ